jgi:hypothetical protein
MIWWGLHVNQAWRGAKAARGEAFPREGGGKRAGHHRHAAIWAERAGWAGREAEAQWGEGERAGQRPWPRGLGQKPELGPIQEVKPFRILFGI